MSSGLRRSSALLRELSSAEAKIEILEDFISERERQFHAAVSRLRSSGRRTSRPQFEGGARRRRAGITSDVLLRMQSHSNESFEQVDDNVYLEELGEYACLRLVRVESGSTSEGHVPFSISRLVGRLSYHVGPDETIIGTSTDCNICVPAESEVWPKQVKICWISGATGTESGHFEISDLTEGKNEFKILPASRAPANIDGAAPKSSEDIESEDQPFCQGSNKNRFPLHHGIQFQTGRLVWSLTALPKEQIQTIKMFVAAREGNLRDLCEIFDDSKCLNQPSPFVFVTSPPTEHRISQYKFSTLSVFTEQGIDVNTEYQPPNTGDMSGSYSRLSSIFSPSVVSQIPSLNQYPCLLLHIAVVNGDLDMVKYLLDKGADVNQKSGPLAVTSLHIASQLGHTDILIQLLKRGGDVEIRDSNGHTPLDVTTSYEIRKLLLNSVLLCAGSEAGDLKEVSRLLIECDVPVNVCGLRHKAALHLASSRGHAAMVDLLLYHGVNYNARGGSRKRTPLHYASLYNHVAVATKLLEVGASECSRDEEGLTPLNLSMGGDMCKLLHKQPLSLCLAVQSEDIGTVKQLLEENEELTENLVDQRNEHSHAPLHIACTTGNRELVELLISHQANVNLRGGCDGWTPVFYAAMAGHSSLVEFLMTVGANTEELDALGESVEVKIQHAIEAVEERLEQLLKATESPVSTPSEGNTLHLPVAMTRQESGTSFSIDNERGWLRNRCQQLKDVAAVLTPAHERLLKAIETRNHSEFVQVLSRDSLNPDILVDRHYPVPALIKTVQLGLFQFTEELLKRGATIATTGPADSIPILVAAENGHSDILQLLLVHGTEVNIQSTDTKTTALHEASSCDSLECVQYLLCQGADKSILDCNGDSAFDCATQLEIRELLAFGVKELLVAACVGDSGKIQSLVTENGFSASHEFRQGVTALHEACEGGYKQCVDVLVDLGADVNKQTHTTQVTPLHIASRMNNFDIASALIRAGAKLGLKDSDGKVPFEVASSNQMRKILIEARSMLATPVQYQHETSKEAQLCKICMDNTINTIVLPCGHQAFCTTCVSQISVCALDRKPIREVITIFK